MTEDVYLILDLAGICVIAWMLYFTEAYPWLMKEFTFDLSSARNAATISAGSIRGSPPIAQNVENTSTPKSGEP